LNKIGDNKSMAEEAEKRRLAERKPSKRNRSQAQNWKILKIELDRIRHTVTYARQYLKQEPSALAVRAGICTGGAE
ncbi:MAG: hypothetical protein GY941_22555, partial [Planctomycetes bacterium]|nr:hypothetical protein [Planctomycetota bacterium]